MQTESHVIKPLLKREYRSISHGQGIYLFDTQGKRYLDACSGAVAANIGHGIREVIEAQHAQAEKISFVYRSQFTSEPLERLGAKLAAWAPGDLKQVFFVNSGSEATETALKIAVQYWQERGRSSKVKVLSRASSYHGITLGALSMSGHAARRKRFEVLLEDWPVVEAPYCYRCPLGKSYPACEIACADGLEQAIQQIGAENIAAFICEPISGASGGAITPPPGYYQRIRALCDKHEILLIADEVMTGNGRTGKAFAIEHWAVAPDLLVLGKGLSGGYTPMAAVVVRSDIVATIRAGSGLIMSGHTFSGNPLSAATCLAVLEYIEEHKLIENSAQMGELLKEGLLELAKRYHIIGEIRGKGLLLGLEFVKNRETRETLSPGLAFTERLIDRAFQLGLLIYGATGALADQAIDAILIAPPLVITEPEILELLSLFERALSELTEELNL